MAEIHRLARETGEPVEVENEAGEATVVISVPGPLPPDPIDRVRDALASRPKPSSDHFRKARELSLVQVARLVATLEVISEAAREA